MGCYRLCPPLARLQLVILVHAAERAPVGAIIAVALAAELVKATLEKLAVHYLIATRRNVPP